MQAKLKAEIGLGSPMAHTPPQQQGRQTPQSDRLTPGLDIKCSRSSTPDARGCDKGALEDLLKGAPPRIKQEHSGSNMDGRAPFPGSSFVKPEPQNFGGQMVAPQQQQVQGNDFLSDFAVDSLNPDVFRDLILEVADGAGGDFMAEFNFADVNSSTFEAPGPPVSKGPSAPQQAQQPAQQQGHPSQSNRPVPSPQSVPSPAGQSGPASNSNTAFVHSPRPPPSPQTQFGPRSTDSPSQSQSATTASYPMASSPRGATQAQQNQMNQIPRSPAMMPMGSPRPVPSPLPPHMMASAASPQQPQQNQQGPPPSQQTASNAHGSTMANNSQARASPAQGSGTVGSNMPPGNYSHQQGHPQGHAHQQGPPPGARPPMYPGHPGQGPIGGPNNTSRNGQATPPIGSGGHFAPGQQNGPASQSGGPAASLSLKQMAEQHNKPMTPQGPPQGPYQGGPSTGGGPNGGVRLPNQATYPLAQTGGPYPNHSNAMVIRQQQQQQSSSNPMYVQSGHHQQQQPQQQSPIQVNITVVGSGVAQQPNMPQQQQPQQQQQTGHMMQLPGGSNGVNPMINPNQMVQQQRPPQQQQIGYVSEKDFWS